MMIKRDLSFGVQFVAASILLLSAVSCGPEIRESAARDDGARQQTNNNSDVAARAERQIEQAAPPAVDENGFPEGVCRINGDGGTIRVNPRCIRQDMAIAPGLNLTDLGTIGVATFEVVGTVTPEGSGRVLRNAGPDTMDVTETIVRRLLDNGVTLVERERSVTDALLQELSFSASGLVDDNTAPSIGHQLGVQTLIVGRYEFSGEFAWSVNEAGEMILGRSRKIGYQVIRIKALDVERGQVLIDAKFSMTGNVADILMPQVLARYGVLQILERIRPVQETF